MVRAVDHEAIEGETDGARDESGINRRSDGRCKGCIPDQ